MKSCKMLGRLLTAAAVLLALSLLLGTAAVLVTAVRMQIAMFSAVPPAQAEDLLRLSDSPAAFREGMAALEAAGYSYTGGRLLLRLLGPTKMTSWWRSTAERPGSMPPRGRQGRRRCV